MAWNTTAVNIVRVLIADPSGTDHTDSSIKHAFVISLHLLLRELNVYTTYTIDMSLDTISPDPESEKELMNVVALKTAVLLIQSEVKTAAGKAVRIKDGPSEIDLGDNYKPKLDLYRLLQSEYEKAKVYYMMNLGGRSILGPYTENMPPVHNFF